MWAVFTITLVMLIAEPARADSQNTDPPGDQTIEQLKAQLVDAKARLQVNMSSCPAVTRGESSEQTSPPATDNEPVTPIPHQAPPGD